MSDVFPVPGLGNVIETEAGETWPLPGIGNFTDTTAGAPGRTTKNTRTWNLGTRVGAPWRMPA
jgi:hypothetical protein